MATFTNEELLTELRLIRAALSPLPEDPERRCVGCPPIVNALLLLESLERRVRFPDRQRKDEGSGGVLGAVLLFLAALAVIGAALLTMKGIAT